MKKWIIRLALAFVVLGVLALVLVFVFLNSIVKKGVEQVGPQLTKTEVRLNTATLSPFSGSGELNGLFVGNPEGFKSESAIKVGDVKVSVDTGSVFSDVVVVKSIVIQAPEITFEGSLRGNNLTKLLENLNSSSGGERTGDKAPAEQGGKKFKVADIKVEGAKVHIQISGLKAMTVPLPPLHLENVGTHDDGVTAAELSRKILQPLLASVMKVVTENAGADILKDLGEGGTENVEKATKGLKGLFKK